MNEKETILTDVQKYFIKMGLTISKEWKIKNIAYILPLIFKK